MNGDGSNQLGSIDVKNMMKYIIAQPFFDKYYIEFTPKNALNMSKYL